MAELEGHSELLSSLDPSEFLASFSKAEALSWRIRSEEGSAPGGFAYVLVDQHDRVVSAHDESGLLDNYLVDAEPVSASSGSHSGNWEPLREQKIQFAHSVTQDSWGGLRSRVAPSSGHLLIELRDAQGERARFGYVINRADFPANLLALSERGHRALLLPETTNNPALRKTLQSSFGLTNAEADVTLHLASGETLKEASAQLRVSVNTTRNQLQSVFSKSGVSRQSELILVVTQLGIIVSTHTQSTALDGVSNVPRAETRAQPTLEMLVLADGRQLAYRCYGDRQGKPVLYLHESYGTGRLPDRTQQLAVERDLLIISPDRPGYGFSSASPIGSMASVTADLRALVRATGQSKIALCGFLSGAGFALELAHDAGAEVGQVVLVAGRVPAFSTPDSSTDTAGKAVEERTALQRFRQGFVNQQWLLNSFFNILRNRSSPKLYASLLQRAYGSNAKDQALFDEQPELLDFLVANCVESQSVSAMGVANDMRAFLGGSEHSAQTLNFELDVWHGTEDQVANPDTLRRFLTGCRVNWRDFAGEGAMLLHHHYDELLDELARGDR